MSPAVIDLTLSDSEPDDDESPTTLLRSFSPRKEKIASGVKDGVQPVLGTQVQAPAATKQNHDRKEARDENGSGEEKNGIARRSQAGPVIDGLPKSTLKQSIPTTVKHGRSGLSSSPAVAGTSFVLAESIDQSLKRGALIPSESPIVQKRPRLELQLTDNIGLSPSDATVADAAPHLPATQLQSESRSTITNSIRRQPEASSSKLHRGQVLGSGFVKPWSAKEDAQLLKHTYRERDWDVIALKFYGRTAGACHLRYDKLKALSQPHEPLHDLPLGGGTSHKHRIVAYQTPPITLPSPRNNNYTDQDDALLVRLREQGQTWTQIMSHFPGRTKGALQTRYSTTSQHLGIEPVSTLRNPWSKEDDALLSKLKGLDNLPWRDIVTNFPHRTAKAVEGRFQKIKEQSLALDNGQTAGDPPIPNPDRRRARHSSSERSTMRDSHTTELRKHKRRKQARMVDGFVSWAQADRDGAVDDEATEEDEPELVLSTAGSQDHIFPNTLSRILRERAVGQSGNRGWSPTTLVPEELKNHAFSTYTLTKHMEGTSGDVHCLAWHPDGGRFAAGSIAVSDERSQQYNGPLNLLVGDLDGNLHELPEHHVDRPIVQDDATNPNSYPAMQRTQDPRLFMTVSAVAFAPKYKRLITAGYDKKVHYYSLDGTKVRHRYSIPHSANVDVLDISAHGLLATGCSETSKSNVHVFKCGKKEAPDKPMAELSATCKQSTLIPRALKWGLAPQNQQYLLAGFSGESNDEDDNPAGGVGLWLIQMDGGEPFRVELEFTSKTVFDVAWNPTPSAASTMFAVASARGSSDIPKRMRTVIQCYSPLQMRQKAITWQCPALDINDMLYCPHDSNLIAAGATDGKVYIWDQRYTRSKPLHELCHGDSMNVLPHDQAREMTDTGVRFLSWGATSSRLYSGSSDGVVKVWNPYRASVNALVQDVATFQSAIMSGSFSPDYRDLLIGEEKGRLNLLSVGCNNDDNDHGHADQHFKIHHAQPDSHLIEDTYTAAKDLVSTGQVEYRPMGALPVRQAVQGPNYIGPWDQAKTALKNAETAWLEQKLVIDKAQLILDEIDDEDALKSALHTREIRVEAAEKIMEGLRRRKDQWPSHEANAKETQRAFRMAEVASTPRCGLDCNYIPRDTDNEDVEDSHRSEQRIPEFMRAIRALPRSISPTDAKLPSVRSSKSSKSSLDLTVLDQLFLPPLPPRVSIAAMTCTDLHRLGLASRCPHCTSPTATSSNPLIKANIARLCQARLQSLKASLDKSCCECGAPIASGAAIETQRCERCDFACPRCSEPARVSARTKVVECETCGVVFKAGVLGYEQYDEFEDLSLKRVVRTTATSDAEHVGDSELEHYASLWGT